MSDQASDVVRPAHGVAGTDRGAATCYCGWFSWIGPAAIEKHAESSPPAPTDAGGRDE